VTGGRVEILISFNVDDVHLAEALRASLFMLEPNHQFVLSPASYGAVLFRENIAAGVTEADAFLLLIGPQGISSWQEIEFGIAVERNKQDRYFPLVAVLAAHSQVPPSLIPFGLNWFTLPVMTDRTMLRQLLSEIQSRCAGRPKIVRSASKDFLREN
jgi:hypothetical protein